MGSYSRDGNEPSHERRDEPLVAEEEDMVFNTIACANTHLNGGVYIYELHFNGGREKSFVDGFAPTASINAWKQATGFY